MMDKSPQGFIDRDIVPLLDKLNSLGDYETTSSCSGRIVLLTDQEKGLGKWIFKSHSEVDAGDVLSALAGSSGTVWFMQEPMILHVKCGSLSAAQVLLDVANRAGLKKCGIMSSNSLVVEIRGTDRIEAPLSRDVSEEYVSFIVEEANRKLRKAKESMKRLENAVSDLFSHRIEDSNA